MAHDEVIADLQARLSRLEQENRQLTDQLNRRVLFKRVGAAAVGVTATAAAGQVLGATPAAAADGQPLLIGKPNQGTETTELFSNVPTKGALNAFNLATTDTRLGRGVSGLGKDIGVVGYGELRAGVIGGFSPLASSLISRIDRTGVGGIGPQDATGVTGVSESGTGTSGTSQSGQGVTGRSVSSTGVDGVSESGIGTWGTSVSNIGAAGMSTSSTGVDGVSISGAGVTGRSQESRGGVFNGGAAAIQLIPSGSPNPPTAGAMGDLLVDSTGRLWFCKQGGTTATWVNLA